MAPKRLPAFLTASEQSLLLAHLNQATSSREGMINAILIRLMLNNGFRASEIINLRYRDVDWDSGNAWVREGKGKKDRAIKIAEADLTLVLWWVERFRGTVGPTSWVFCTINGNRLDDRWLRRMVKRECAKAGITKDVHPHSLRHSFATDYYGETRDLLNLQMVLGHSDVRATMVYVHLNPAKALQTTNELATKRLSACSAM